MEFQVKTFAQLMILSHEVALIFDDITKGEFAIDSYEIAERPDRIKSDLKEAMNQGYDIAMESSMYKDLYGVLYNASNDEVFWSLLKKKNDQRKRLL